MCNLILVTNITLILGFRGPARKYFLIYVGSLHDFVYFCLGGVQQEGQ